jgi:hypothetical protein
MAGTGCQSPHALRGEHTAAASGTAAALEWLQSRYHSYC